MDRPGRFNGMRHIAFTMPNLEECVQFYTEIMGMEILNRAHADLVYLSCGNDNLSLGRADLPASGVQRMDHFGFIVDSKEELEQWYLYFQSKGVTLLDRPHDHGDGARSFHLTDPAGNVIQPLYHPAISGQRFSRPE
ncbi:glyoxalase [Zobellella denitrificans]|jgi:catechol 2,3-dioxygenase-like lactoylglutathione lyase family enzyme|uniref:VOC family protein n=1 Tax=Zobellella taiwanensis TaxID=347535 RepID=A0A2P7R166_9GAMM|nr:MULTISPECIES: VOC family protein [Zobellella]OXS13711.1 glyoxalase [Zobellella denitrificans]PSJ43941.1 VOC family protein [Zobellella taiwanensis]